MADNREDKSERPIIIKRVKKYSHGAHGGVWKIIVKTESGVFHLGCDM